MSGRIWGLCTSLTQAGNPILITSLSFDNSVTIKAMRFRARGLSVLEVIVAIAVLAIAGLGIIATLTRVMVAQSSSSHETVGRILAESKLQDAILAGPANWGIPSPVDWGETSGSISEVQSQSAVVGQNPLPTEYFYQIEVVEVSGQNEAGTPMFGIDVDPSLKKMGKLWEVNVKVWWNSDSGAPQGAIERGTQTLTVSKVIYIET